MLLIYGCARPIAFIAFLLFNERECRAGGQVVTCERRGAKQTARGKGVYLRPELLVITRKLYARSRQAIPAPISPGERIATVGVAIIGLFFM